MADICIETVLQAQRFVGYWRTFAANRPIGPKTCWFLADICIKLAYRPKGLPGIGGHLQQTGL